MMQPLDDEMLFEASEDLDIILPTIVNDNKQQSQPGSTKSPTRRRKRSRASSFTMSKSRTSGHEGDLIDDSLKQLPTPISTAKVSKQDAKLELILPPGKRDRYYPYQGAYSGTILSHLILLRIPYLAVDIILCCPTNDRAPDHG